MVGEGLEDWALVDLLESVLFVKGGQPKSLHMMMGEPREMFLLSQLKLELPADFVVEEELRFLSDPKCLETLRT